MIKKTWSKKLFVVESSVASIEEELCGSVLELSLVFRKWVVSISYEHFA